MSVIQNFQVKHIKRKIDKIFHFLLFRINKSHSILASYLLFNEENCVTLSIKLIEYFMNIFFYIKRLIFRVFSFSIITLTFIKKIVKAVLLNLNKNFTVRIIKLVLKLYVLPLAI